MAGATKDRRGELVDRRMLTEPSAYWTQLGADGPVRWSEHHRGWLVLSHAEVSDAFRDHRLSADRVGSLERAAAHHPEAFARTVEQRLDHAFIDTFRPGFDDRPPMRSWATMAEYRHWCEENLEPWLGYCSPEKARQALGEIEGPSK